MELLAEYLILYIHAPLGGVALLSGGISLISKKGSRLHKKLGEVFFYSMLLSAFSALVVSVLPNHESPFLFSIGLFSTYFLVSGIRSLKYKQEKIYLSTDKIIAYLICITGFVMVSYPIILYSKLNLILTVFGLASIVFGFRDLSRLKDEKHLRKGWLKLHLGKMTGGYIAAASAFFVVNQILPSVWNWFAPALIGSIYIAYWINKLNKKSNCGFGVNLYYRF
jgi:uncharacterized membrane protein